MEPRSAAVGRSTPARPVSLHGVPVPSRAFGIGGGWLRDHEQPLAASIATTVEPCADVIDLTVESRERKRRTAAA